jgi:hypothetical protein
MSLTESLGPIIAVIAASVLSALGTWLLAANRLPTSHRVAILGFPRCGKTTLITAIFEYLFRHGAQGGSIIPRGDETIQRINDNLRQLELRKPINPTTDQDVFAYRGEVVAGPGPFRRRYKLEIGDFPGEDTLAFTERFGEWLHNSPYFQWASSADAFVFVINVGEVLMDRQGEYVARQKSAFRAAWQRLQEHHLDGKTNLSAKPLLLVFAKADLLLWKNAERSKLDALGSGALISMRSPVSEEEIRRAARDVIEQFDDLIAYFERESRQFHIIHTSVFAMVRGEERLGVPELARRVLPRPALLPFIVPVARTDRVTER